MSRHTGYERTEASDKPKRCPFCGAVNVTLRAIDDWAQVECDDCGAKGPVYGDEETPIAVRKQDAVDAWNVPPRTGLFSKVRLRRTR